MVLHYDMRWNEMKVVRAKTLRHSLPRVQVHGGAGEEGSGDHTPQRSAGHPASFPQVSSSVPQVGTAYVAVSRESRRMRERNTGRMAQAVKQGMHGKMQEITRLTIHLAALRASLK